MKQITQFFGRRESYFKLLEKRFELKDEAQISRLPQFYIYYVFEMEKFQSFRIICKKLVEKLLFCASTNIQVKEPVRNLNRIFSSKSQLSSFLISRLFMMNLKL